MVISRRGRSRNTIIHGSLRSNKVVVAVVVVVVVLIVIVVVIVVVVVLVVVVVVIVEWYPSTRTKTGTGC